MVKRPVRYLAAAAVLLGLGYFAVRAAQPPSPAAATSGEASAQRLPSATPTDAPPADHPAPLPSAAAGLVNSAEAGDSLAGDKLASPSNLPPTPPSATLADARPPADPLSDAEAAKKRRRGLALIDLALARVTRDLQAAEDTGDEVRAAELRVRQARLTARRQERLGNIGER